MDGRHRHQGNVSLSIGSRARGEAHCGASRALHEREESVPAGDGGRPGRCAARPREEHRRREATPLRPGMRHVPRAGRGPASVPFLRRDAIAEGLSRREANPSATMEPCVCSDSVECARYLGFRWNPRLFSKTRSFLP